MACWVSIAPLELAINVWLSLDKFIVHPSTPSVPSVPFNPSITLTKVIVSLKEPEDIVTVILVLLLKLLTAKPLVKPVPVSDTEGFVDHVILSEKFCWVAVSVISVESLGVLSPLNVITCLFADSDNNFAFVPFAPSEPFKDKA